MALNLNSFALLLPHWKPLFSSVDLVLDLLFLFLFFVSFQFENVCVFVFEEKESNVPKPSVLFLFAQLNESCVSDGSFGDSDKDSDVDCCLMDEKPLD